METDRGIFSLSFQASLQFLYFNLEKNVGCTNDYLEVYNGEKPTPGSLIGRYCGSDIPAGGIQGDSRTLLIVFKTNSAVTATGFAAIYLTPDTRKSKLRLKYKKTSLKLTNDGSNEI